MLVEAEAHLPKKKLLLLLSFQETLKGDHTQTATLKKNEEKLFITHNFLLEREAVTEGSRKKES